MNFKHWLESKQLELPFPDDSKFDGRNVVDTRASNEDDNYKLGHAAWFEGNELVGIHVTDNPEKVARILKTGADIGYSYNSGQIRTEELGSGLYISAIPQSWMGRSPGKYDFAKHLTSQQKKRLADAILNHPSVIDTHYLASFEREYVRRDVKKFLDTNTSDAIDFIVSLAGQPYNIRFWEPDFLAPLGIKAAKQPEQVEVRAKGKFIDLTDRQGDYKLMEKLRPDFQGAFAKQGFTSTGQCCIWKTKAITKFGSLYP